MPEELEDQNTELTEETEVEETDTEEVVEETKPQYDEETLNAIKLAKALNDPNRAPILIRNMAIQMGFIDPDAPKSQNDKAVKSLVDEIQEMLPEGYEDIGKALLPAIEHLVSKRLGDVKSEVDRRFAQQAAVETERNYNRYVRANKVTDEEANELISLTRKYPVNPELSLDEYLDPLLELVRTRKGNQQKQIATKQKQANNLKSRLPGNRGESNEETLQQNMHAKTPKEAVLMALKQLEGKK